MSDEKVHSILGASSMYRWSACPGSVRECRGIPSVSSAAADAGTKAHTHCERFVRSEMTAQEFWALDEEMRNCVQLYFDTLFRDYHGRKWPATSPPSGNEFPVDERKLLIEHQFDLSSVYPDCFGTSDAVMWKPSERLLLVYDYKHGVSVVEARNNQQMLYYALGALVTLKFPAKFVEVVIVQPRAKHREGPVRRWRIPALELLEFEADLIEACKRTEDPFAPLNPGRHCFFCPAKPACPALVKAAQQKAAEEFGEIVDDIFS